MFELTPDRPVAMIGKVSFPTSNHDSNIRLNLTGEAGRFLASTTLTIDPPNMLLELTERSRALQAFSVVVSRP